MDKIVVIEQTTSERENEIKQLFEECKPIMEKGYTLNQAVQQVKNVKHHSFSQRAWYRNLIAYAEKQGYKERYND